MQENWLTNDPYIPSDIRVFGSVLTTAWYEYVYIFRNNILLNIQVTYTYIYIYINIYIYVKCSLR